MSFASTDTYRFEFSTRDLTGALANATGTPTGTLVVDGVDTATSVTITNPATGRYKGSVSLSGLSDGAIFYVRVSASPAGVASEANTPTHRIDASVASRLATSGYTAPDNAGIATAASNAASAATAAGQAKTAAEGAQTAAEAARAAAEAVEAGDAPTVDEIAARLLVDPANKLDVADDGSVVAGGGGGGGTGNGDVPVDHDYGGADALRFTLEDGTPVDDALVTALIDNAANGQTRTGSDGRWVAPLMLDAGTYSIVFSKPGLVTQSVEVEVA